MLWVTLNEPQRGHNTVFASTGQVFGEHKYSLLIMEAGR
jgi:hypothetical protein